MYIYIYVYVYIYIDLLKLCGVGLMVLLNVFTNVQM